MTLCTLAQEHLSQLSDLLVRTAHHAAEECGLLADALAQHEEWAASSSLADERPTSGEAAAVSAALRAAAVRPVRLT
jgi:hypothetical protein